ncbi:MAG TPA: hypothetical protein VLB00_02475 [Gemmatimonadales bacterium]|nr:hypothetical protein [Gemmatimonadales bacterium]
MLPRPETAAATRRNIARKYKLSEFPEPRQYLHIRCGDDILDQLTAGGISGDKIKWFDALCEGPLHHHATDRARQKERAAWAALRFDIPLTELYRDLMGQDWRVDQAVHYDETVLWFEADLFDQLILVYLLNRLAPLRRRTRLSLICIGSFPGVKRFIGLGQLRPAQLATLFPRRRPVTWGQLRLARRTWDALLEPEPLALSRIGAMRSTALPFLPAAVRRYLAEYPSVRNGLGRTEQLALEAIAAGAGTGAEVFVAVQNRERRPYMGDTMLYAVLRGLASGRFPAIAGAHRKLSRLDPARFAQEPLRLTDTGKGLLANQLDWFAVSGVIRQIGGVTMRGAGPRWRWDTRRRVIVEQRWR